MTQGPVPRIAWPRPSRTVAWLALLAFLLQGLVVQSHVHLTALQAAAPQQNHQPAQKAPDECPVCQLYAATAAALAPDSIITLLPLTLVGRITHVFVAITGPGIRHQAWQSRAPPRA
jgi:hypothetical protein